MEEKEFSLMFKHKWQKEYPDSILQVDLSKIPKYWTVEKFLKYVYEIGVKEVNLEMDNVITIVTTIKDNE